MSNIIELPSKEQINEQASQWIAKLDRNLTATEQQKLQHWLQQNDEHRAVFFEMAKLWDKMDSLARLADLFQPPATQKARRLPYFYGAAAASFVFSIMIILLHLGGEHTQPILALFNTTPLLSDDTYQTSVGEHSSKILSDGSRLVLNTNSRVKVKYTAEQRLFLLEQGEINIEVAHNKSRPLNVVARDKIVQAIGTAFNVRIMNDKEIQLIVTDGKVLVGKRDQQLQNVEHLKTRRLSQDAMAVSKGEKVMLGSKQENVAKVAAADLDAELSWREGNIIFRGETLEQALIEISRYTSIEFEILDNEIKHERIAGLFKAGDVSGLLQTLDQNFNIHNEHVGNNKIRLRARTGAE
ncbi:MAG: FecR domain-containing protein [Pseudomonadota bacterium]